MNIKCNDGEFRLLTFISCSVLHRETDQQLNLLLQINM